MEIGEKRITRRDALKYGAAAGLGLTALPALLSACGGETTASSASPSASAPMMATLVPGTIKLLAWQGYDNKKNLATLQKDYGVTTSTTYIAGDQEVFTKLGAQKGIGAWDVLTYNSGLVPSLYEMGVLEPILPSSVPNSADVYPEFMTLDFIHTGDGDTMMGIPFAWGYQGFVRSGNLPEVTSWDQIFDATYKKKIVSVNDPTTAVATACLASGFTQYDKLTKDQLNQAMDWWYKLKPNLRTIVGDYGVAKDLLVRGEIDGTVPGWQALVAWAAADGATLYHDFPEQGVYGFMDLLTLIKGAKDPAAALGWINFTLSPQAQANMGTEMSEGITNQKGVPMLSQELQDAYQYANLTENFQKSPIRRLPPFRGQGDYVGFVDWAAAWERFTAA
jgi:spermidine/putrescine-binding protein